VGKLLSAKDSPSYVRDSLAFVVFYEYTYIPQCDPSTKNHIWPFYKFCSLFFTSSLVSQYRDKGELCMNIDVAQLVT